MKLIILILFISTTLSSCLVSVPLVVNSPAATNTNIVTNKNQIAATAAYLNNSKINGETKQKSNALQSDIKYALTKNVFIEGQAFSQSEKSERHTTTSSNRMPDTLNSNKNYKRNGYSFGIGVYKKISNDNLLYIAISAGIQHNGTKTQTTDITNNNPPIVDMINFKQNGFYLNPSLIIYTPTFQYTIGLQNTFAKYYNVISNSLGYNKAFVDSLTSITNIHNFSSQFYNAFAFEPFSIPLILKLQVGLNLMKLPTNLRSRTFGISVGLAYMPFKNKR